MAKEDIVILRRPPKAALEGRQIHLMSSLN
jgi:hypothetical protein